MDKVSGMIGLNISVKRFSVRLVYFCTINDRGFRSRKKEENNQEIAVDQIDAGKSRIKGSGPLWPDEDRGAGKGDELGGKTRRYLPSDGKSNCKRAI